VFELKHLNYQPVGQTVAKIDSTIEADNVSTTLWAGFTSKFTPLFKEFGSQLTPPKKLSRMRQLDMKTLGNVYNDYFEEIKPLHRKNWFLPVLISLIMLLALVGLVILTRKKGGVLAMMRWALSGCRGHRRRELVPTTVALESTVSQRQIPEGERHGTKDGDPRLYPVLVAAAT